MRAQMHMLWLQQQKNYLHRFDANTCAHTGTYTVCDPCAHAVTDFRCRLALGRHGGFMQHNMQCSERILLDRPEIAVVIF